MGNATPKAEAVTRGARMLRTALGPDIAAFLEDPAVAEVMLNPDGRLWTDRLSEGLSDTGAVLTPADGERIIRLVAHHVGAEVHPNSPRVSAELPGTGERFEGLLPPVVAAPAFAIRKPAVAVFTLDDYARTGIMTAAQAVLLRKAVTERRNILVAGGTSTGKTTLTKTPASCNAPRRIWWRCAPRTASPPSPTSCAPRSGCVLTASRSARCAVPRRSICSRRGAPGIPVASAPSMPEQRSARYAASSNSSRKPSSPSRAP